jgi:hypothetical protein
MSVEQEIAKAVDPHEIQSAVMEEPYFNATQVVVPPLRTVTPPAAALAGGAQADACLLAPKQRRAINDYEAKQQRGTSSVLLQSAPQYVIVRLGRKLLHTFSGLHTCICHMRYCVPHSCESDAESPATGGTVTLPAEAPSPTGRPTSGLRGQSRDTCVRGSS